MSGSNDEKLFPLTKSRNETHHVKSSFASTDNSHFVDKLPPKRPANRQEMAHTKFPNTEAKSLKGTRGLDKMFEQRDFIFEILSCGR